MDEKAVKKIDFLKIDVEGFEREVIEGMGSQCLKVIQFEFAPTNFQGIHLPK